MNRRGFLSFLGLVPVALPAVALAAQAAKPVFSEWSPSVVNKAAREAMGTWQRYARSSAQVYRDFEPPKVSNFEIIDFDSIYIEGNVLKCGDKSYLVVDASEIG